MKWFFAYGSLLWDENSNLEYETDQRARLLGYHRDFNKKSVAAWGDSENPAPVLGLEEGKSCIGRAYGLSDNTAQVLEDLEDREGPSYNLNSAEVHLDSGETVEAHFFMNERNHTYIGDEPIDTRARMSLEASGNKGTGENYVRNTRRELDNMGINDPTIETYVAEMDRLTDRV